MRMRSVEVKACSTTYVMESPEAALTVKFTSPLLLDDLKVLARPVTYVSLKAQGRHGRPLPACSATLLADEALCLDYAGQCPVESGEAVGKGYEAVTLSSGVQQPLNRSGDDVRIDWGRLYLAVEPAGTTSVREENGRTAIQAQIPLEEGKEVLFALAYDEVFAIQYFGQNLEPYWKKERETLSGLLELSSGVSSLTGAGTVTGRLSMAAFMLGWAGLSVHCQVLAFLGDSGLSLRTYLTGKLLHGGLSALFTALLVRRFPLEAPVSSYLAEQVEGIASLDFQRALTISTAAAWGVWLLFVALAVYMVKKSSGKPRPKRV